MQDLKRATALSDLLLEVWLVRDERMETANNFLKENQFAEAGKLFRQVWEEENNAYAASKYLYCLRKAGYPEAAIKQGEKAFSQLPENVYVQRELVWAHYEMVKAVKEQQDLQKLLQAASSLIKLKPDILPLELTVFAVIKLAKDKQDWRVVSTWCDKIAPAEITDETSGYNEHKIKSKRQQWYFAKVKSLIELKDWKPARSLALEAANIYPTEINFKRWSVLALANLENVEQAIAELEDLIIKNREEWYLYKDLCDLYLESEQQKPAFRFACKAALAPGEDKAKVTLYQQIAQIALALGKLEIAARHLELTKAIRQQEGWAIKANLEKLEADISRAFVKQRLTQRDFLNDIPQLIRLCRRNWKEESYRGLPRQTGIIASLHPHKTSAWIHAEDGSDIFCLQKDLPPFLRKEQVKVNFALEKSWDKKKERFSVRAVDIREYKP